MMIENILLFLYVFITVGVCVKIITDTTTPSKSLAYLLLVIVLPVVGIIFYLSVGLNYRKRKIYKQKINADSQSFVELNAQNFSDIFNISEIPDEKQLKSLKNRSFTTKNNRVKILTNGEEKFPEVFTAIEKARHHIHIEYYIYDNDRIGNQLAELLIRKQQEGVKVRFIYDDFGSQKIRKSIVKKLKKAGVEAVPFYKITLIYLANRLNYRNHRKIVVIDGKVGFVGGINVSDKYINVPAKKLFWRDTHLKIEGAAVLNLQYTFLTDWNFSAEQNIAFSEEYFPVSYLKNNQLGNVSMQIQASGPDSDYPTILYSLMHLIASTRKEILITTPYFIPNKSLLDVLKIASLKGVNVKLLMPKVSDSVIVNLTAQSYYDELLEAGIEIYLYKKGFIHAKTMVCDGEIATIGTANLDNRSFELNFEINAEVHNVETAQNLRTIFYNDLNNAECLEPVTWEKRSSLKKIIEKVFNLFSSLM